MQMREAAELDVCAEVGDGSVGDLRVLADELLSLKGVAFLEHLASFVRGVVRMGVSGVCVRAIAHMCARVCVCMCMYVYAWRAPDWDCACPAPVA
jgi:hypothetical protein